MKTENIKVALVTDDGATISPHFGRARYYEVITLEQGNIVHRERREKAGHHVFASAGHHDEHAHEGHGFDSSSREKHNQMIATIADCQVVLTRGMGAGAYQHLSEAGIIPIITTLKDIDSAVKEYAAGRIVNHVERLH